MLAPESFYILNRVVEIRYLVAFGAFDLQLRHLANTVAASHNDSARMVLFAVVSGQNKCAILLTIQINDLLA
ncbi:hypothetical protein D3C72_2200660 [compost metagenome]